MAKKFVLKSEYSPSWDQGDAINNITKYLDLWYDWQTLWWVTWSWKTFTMANIIEKEQKPTLVIAHNKTLAAQLAQEFKEFFPNNSVHYFVSYYDYYQPEAYVSKTDTYIEKEATINEEIDRLRHAATQDLLTRKDVIIVASVSCIYGIWDIKSYTDAIFSIEIWKEYIIENLLKNLVDLQYKRAWADFKPWTFQVMWDVLEIFPSSEDSVFTVEFWWNEVSEITRRNHLTWEIFEHLNIVNIFPAKHTVTSKEKIKQIIPEIQKELDKRLEAFKSNWDVLKYERLKTKVEYDIEMMQEVWYVNWIENYSSYLDWRKLWEAPYTLMDYFWDDYLCFIDESHMTIPQIWAMYAWDRARKTNLVENWFRLPSALENRPLKFLEFENKLKQTIAVSATPWTYEIEKSSDNPKYFFEFNPIEVWAWITNENNRIIPQVIRPTWLLDPEIIIRPMDFMVDDIMGNLNKVISKWQRMLITTITKRSSEELADYLMENWVKVKYLHSEVDTLERLEILKELREWGIDVIVWVNLLREGLDLPEVSKIAILDADKQWFLRSESSLIQIIWRAARNSEWKVYMYVQKIKDFDKSKKKNWLYILDKWKYFNESWLVISNAMKKAIDLTNYRRSIQSDFNKKNKIIPTTVFSSIKDIWIDSQKKHRREEKIKDIKKEISKLELEMDIASSNMDFELAAELRDKILELKGRKKR